ncbi:MAG: AsmA family protein [Elusimicrobia bacterium]|nr:AsmA family protein [Elusimicrobiota bacterium]
MLKKFFKSIPRGIAKFCNKHKIFTRIIFYAAAAVIILVLAAELTLRYALPSEKIKNKITQTVSEKINGDFKIDKISAGLTGLDLRGVTLAAGGRQIVSVNRVRVHFSLLALFKRELRVNAVLVDGLNANVIKDKTGKFNFEPLIPQTTTPAPQPQPENQKKSNPLVYPYIRALQLTDGNITYKDEQQNIALTVRDLAVDMSGINLEGPFTAAVNAAADLAYQNINVQNIKLGLAARPDLSKEFVEIVTMAAGYKDSSINLRGQVWDFENPKIYFETETKKLVSSSFQDIVQTPEFDLTSLKTNGEISTDLKAQKITLENLDINTVASKITANGAVTLGKKLVYKAATTGTIALDKTPQLLPLLAAYKPQGTAAWDLASENMDVSGTLTADNIGAYTDAAGDLEKLNTKINIKDIKHIDMPSLTANLNGYPLESKLKISIGKTSGEVSASLKAKRIYVKTKPAPKEQTPEQPAAAPAAPPDNTTLKQKQEQWQQELGLPPLTVTASADIGNFDSQFFKAQTVKFNTDITGLTVMLDQTQGNLNFSTGSGQIKDIYQLTNSNALAKVLFMSVSVVSKVVNALDVLDVLSSLVPKPKTAEQKQAEKENAAAEAQQPPQQINGKLDFDSFATALDFKNGKSEIKQGSFVSDLMSFKLSGNMDFISRALDMTVNAAPGNHPESGNMPLTIKIGGTIDNPQGSMSMLSTFASLITGTILNNPAMKALKAGATAVTGTGAKDNTQPATSPADAPSPVPAAQ